MAFAIETFPLNLGQVSISSYFFHEWEWYPPKRDFMVRDFENEQQVDAS